MLCIYNIRYLIYNQADFCNFIDQSAMWPNVSVYAIHKHCLVFVLCKLHIFLSITNARKHNLTPVVVRCWAFRAYVEFLVDAWRVTCQSPGIFAHCAALAPQNSKNRRWNPGFKDFSLRFCTRACATHGARSGRTKN